MSADSGDGATTCPVCFEDWAPGAGPAADGVPRYPAAQPCGHVVCDDCEARLAERRRRWTESESEDDDDDSDDPDDGGGDRDPDGAPRLCCPLCRAVAPPAGPAWAAVAGGLLAPAGRRLDAAGLAAALGRAYERGAARSARALARARTGWRWARIRAGDAAQVGRWERDRDAVRHAWELDRLRDRHAEAVRRGQAEADRLRREVERQRLEAERQRAEVERQRRAADQGQRELAAARLAHARDVARLTLERDVGDRLVQQLRREREAPPAAPPPPRRAPDPIPGRSGARWTATP